MKFLMTALAIALLSPLAATAAPCEGRGCSLDVILVGVETSPNPNDSRAVRQAIGDSVTDLAVKNYFLKATDIYGGWRACIDPQNERGYDIITDRLGRLRTGPQTRYVVNLVRRCR